MAAAAASRTTAPGQAPRSAPGRPPPPATGAALPGTAWAAERRRVEGRSGRWRPLAYGEFEREARCVAEPRVRGRAGAGKSPRSLRGNAAAATAAAAAAAAGVAPELPTSRLNLPATEHAPPPRPVRSGFSGCPRMRRDARKRLGGHCRGGAEGP